MSNHLNQNDDIVVNITELDCKDARKNCIATVYLSLHTASY